ncbi:MAG: hypothetical protein CVU44_11345 [Chloroflexi bacterium HGW-Chloroflexi-6]|nr:MAG: hypothetical protein CVU44_11345 [Chloroflexi bacterium HGW-Chloroflexi-6]
MKIEIPKIVRPLPLADYAPEYGEAVLQVWVNPPKALKDEMQACLVLTESVLEELRKLKGPEHKAKRAELSAKMDEIGEQIIGWLSKLWSQGPEATRLSIEDVKALIDNTRENDPVLYPWIVKRSWTMILEYRAGVKKK